MCARYIADSAGCARGSSEHSPALSLWPWASRLTVPCREDGRCPTALKSLRLLTAAASSLAPAGPSAAGWRPLVGPAGSPDRWRARSPRSRAAPSTGLCLPGRLALLPQVVLRCQGLHLRHPARAKARARARPGQARPGCAVQDCVRLVSPWARARARPGQARPGQVRVRVTCAGRGGSSDAASAASCDLRWPLLAARALAVSALLRLVFLQRLRNRLRRRRRRRAARLALVRGLAVRGLGLICRRRCSRHGGRRGGPRRGGLRCDPRAAAG